MRLVRLGRLRARGVGGTLDNPGGRGDPLIGWILAVAGFLMAGVPLAMLSLLFWLLGDERMDPRLA